MTLSRLAVALVMLSTLLMAQEPAIPVKETPAVDRNAFTFTDYSLNFHLDVAKHVFNARGRVTIRNDSARSQALVALQVSSSLKWATIRMQDKTLEFTSSRVISDIDHTGAVQEAVVTLSGPLAPGESAELEIGYQGTIEQDASRLQRLGMPADIAKRSDWDQIAESFTGIRGVGHVVWYPVALEPATLGDGNRLFKLLGEFQTRHAESRFRATYHEESGLTLVANGVRRETAEGIEFFLARMGMEGPFFLAAKYRVFDTAQGRVNFLPGSDDAARRYGGILAKLEPTVTNGRSVPVEIFEIPAKWASYESSTMLITPLIAASEKELQLQIIHTLTHANLYSSRPWIYEGLAHFAQLALREQQDGHKAALDFLNERRVALSLAEPENTPANEAKGSLVNSGDEIIYRTKAMFVWWMLRDMLGEAVLKKALAEYKPGSDKEPAYIQRLLEAASRKQLEWFFSDWVYRDRGLPDFEIAAAYPRQNLKGSYLVTVTVENHGNAGAEVPVRFRMKTGEVVTRLEVMANAKATARIETPRVPLEVVVNDGSVPESDTSNNSFTVPPPK